MSGRIKGITVEIGGDTTGLNKALGGVNKEIRTTQAQLKDVERLLKLDPTNTKLLEQRQRLLADAVAETKGKLDTLKEAEKQVQQQFKAGDVSQAQYDALQREIVETEQRLKDLEKQAGESATALQKISGVGEKLQSAGDKISSAGEKLLPVTAGVAGLATAAVTTAASFESSMSQVQATMGITKDSMSEVNGESVNTMDTLSALAKQMGSETAFSASECAEALNYLALAGYDTQQMCDTLPTVLNLAAAGNIDLASAADMVIATMSALGMGTDEATTMVDQMAKTSSTTKTSVAQLGDAILTIGATAKSVKGGTAELNAALGILANNGIEGAEGGTHLRNVILSLQNPTDKAAACMERLGVDVYDSEGNMRSLNDVLGDLNTSMDGMTSAQRSDIISTIFNKTDLAAAESLLASTGDAWDNLQQSIAESGGAAQQMADTQLDNLQGQLTILKSALEGLAISFGEILLPAVSSVIEWIQSGVDWLNSLDEGTRNSIVTVGLVVAAIGPLLIVIGKITSGIGVILSLFSKIGAGTSFLIANPIALLIAAIVALVALIAAKGDEIQGILQRVDDFLQGVFATDWTTIFGPVLGSALNAFFANLKSVWDSVKQILDGVINFIRGVFTGDWQRAWNGVVGIFSGIFGGLVSIAKAPLNAVIGLINGVLGSIDWVISGLNKLPGVNISNIGRIPYLAKGGILSQGSAVVGEAGPELLTLDNGRAVVQPLSSSTTNHTELGGISITVYGAPGQDVRELARLIMEEEQHAIERKGAVFARA